MDGKVTDYLGKEIKPGQTIVYPGRKGSALWIAKGTVRDVSIATLEFPYGTVSIRTEGGKERILIHPYRVAVVEEPRRPEAVYSGPSYPYLNG